MAVPVVIGCGYTNIGKITWKYQHRHFTERKLWYRSLHRMWVQEINIGINASMEVTELSSDVDTGKDSRKNPPPPPQCACVSTW